LILKKFTTVAGTIMEYMEYVVKYLHVAHLTGNGTQPTFS